MMFARRSSALFSTSRMCGRGRRPSRACRPALGMERCEERTLLSVALVSVNATGTAGGDSDSGFVSTSLDDVAPFVNATQADPGATPVSLSADGTQLVFVSDATDLVGSTTETNNQASNVYVRNTATGQTSLVSAAPDGQPGNGDSCDPVISPNGQYVAFLSLATNLTGVAGQASADPTAPGDAALYVRDLQTQTTTLLDQTPSGQASDGFCTGQFVFSPDSTKIAWIDTSVNLTSAPVDPLSLPTDWGELPSYVYVCDLATNTTSLVSVSTTGQASGNVPESTANATDLVFSPDSQSLVFGSTSTDLTANLPTVSPHPVVPAGNPNPENLFLRNLAAGTTTLLSVTTDGLLDVTADNSGAVFSPDGDLVAFTSTATNLTTNAADPSPSAPLGDSIDPPSNVYVRNLKSGTTTLVSAMPDGLISNGTVATPVFSPDGGSLAFISSAADLMNNPLDPSPPLGASTGSTPSPWNVFLTNLSTGVTSLVSVTPDGMLSSGSVYQIVFSPNGEYLAYTSSASDLTNNATGAIDDYGSISNVFVSNLVTGTTTLASATTDGQLSSAGASGLFFGLEGGALFYTSSATDLTSNPPDASAESLSSQIFGGANLFVYDLSAGTTSLISATTGGQLSDGSTIAGASAFQLSDGQPAINNALLSSNGQTLYFASNADDLPASGTNPSQATQIFSATAPFTTANPPPATPPGSPPPATPPGTKPTTLPTPTSSPAPSPMITSVAPVKSRGGVEKLAITFAQALDSTSAENVNSYGVSILARAKHRHGRHRTAEESSRSIGVASAVYDAADHQVTLTLHAKLRGRQTIQLQLKNAGGSVVDSRDILISGHSRM
jgi:dipeptidyl aminopeptidase/acylaminoacyl peptidase